VAPSGAKDQFYFTVYYITLNSNCETQGVPKNFEKIDEIELESKLMHGLFECNFLCFMEKIMFKNH
jgi:hypothetical protein